VSGDLVVYVHNNLRLIYRQRKEWLKGKTKMWDVFSNDMGLNNSVDLALTNLDLNELVLELVTFDNGDPLEESSSKVHINKCTNCIGYRGEEEEDGGESSGSDANLDDYDIEDY
jgi:hypothetical protein